MSVLFLFASVLTGAWGIASLLHASWLESSDLPGGSATAWGIVLLCVATIEGVSGLLILFSRRIGFVTAIAIAALGSSGTPRSSAPTRSGRSRGSRRTC